MHIHTPSESPWEACRADMADIQYVLHIAVLADSIEIYELADLAEANRCRCALHS